DRILRSHGLAEKAPEPVRAVLQQGIDGQLPETVKHGDPCLKDTHNVIVGGNGDALAAAAVEASRLGYAVLMTPTPLVGETKLAARSWFRWVQEQAPRIPDRVCVLAGGETTVRVSGSGRGGRNQEFALTLAREVADAEWVILSAGSDGIDGVTD